MEVVLIQIAYAGVLPFLVIYTGFHGILHPIQMLSFLKKNFIWAVSILIGVVAYSFAFASLGPSVLPQSTLAWVVAIHIVLLAVVALIFNMKIDPKKNRLVSLLFVLGMIIAFPFWIAGTVMTDKNWRNIVISLISIVIGLYSYTLGANLLVPRFVPLSVLLWVGVAFALIILSAIFVLAWRKSAWSKTWWGAMVVIVALIITIPVWLVGAIIIGLTQGQKQPQTTVTPQSETVTANIANSQEMTQVRSETEKPTTQ